MKVKIAGLFAGLWFVMTVVGCGGGGGGSASSITITSEGTTGDDGGTASGMTQGTVVDPYIVGATFFEDANGNGQWDEGEQVSTASDENGLFSFAATVPAGSTIIMRERGRHQGLPFTGKLLGRVEEGATDIVVSPLTTLAAFGLTADDLLIPLSTLNPYADKYVMDADPMIGLADVQDNTTGDAAIAGLRANLYIGAVLDLFMLNRDHTGITAIDVDNLLNSWAPLSGLRKGLNYAVSAEAITRITDRLPAGYDLPPVTMRDVAEAMPAILNWWKQEVMGQVIAGGEVAISAEIFKSKVDTVQANLGLRYYVRNNQSNQAVQQAIAAGDLTAAGENHPLLQKDGSITTSERTLTKEFLVGQIFFVGNGSRLRFFDSSGTSGNVELVYLDEYSTTTKTTGTWQIADNVLILQNSDSDEVLRLELEEDWTSHLSMRIKGELQNDYAATSFLGKLLAETGKLTVAGS